MIGKYQGQNERHANVAIQINASLCSGKCLGTKTADLYEGITSLKVIFQLISLEASHS